MSLSGIQNLGNTCYISCIFLSLFYNPPLKNFFDAIKVFPNELTKQLKESFHDYHKGKFVPTKFYVVLKTTLERYNNINQHDADEFLIDLLDYLKHTLPSCFEKHRINFKDDKSVEIWGNHKNIISEIFQGQYHVSISCEKCNHVISNFENFIQFEIPFQKNLEDTFKQIMEPEDLPEYVCDKCNEVNCCKKKCSICIFPLCLIFNIKRDETTNVHQFQTTLNINNIVYELYSICNRTGNMENGHYSCTIKHENKWFLINDENVHPIKEPNFKHAYILFYKFVNNNI